MNDNNSSKDTEFDFNNPKESKKIVDPSMIRQGRIPVSNNAKVIGAGILAATFFFYYFFMGSSVKKTVEDEDLRILKTLREEHSKSGMITTPELPAQPQDANSDHSENTSSSVPDETVPNHSSVVPATDQTTPTQEDIQKTTENTQASLNPPETKSVVKKETVSAAAPSSSSEPVMGSSQNSSPAVSEDSQSHQEIQNPSVQKEESQPSVQPSVSPNDSQDPSDKNISKESPAPQVVTSSSWSDQEWQKMKELMITTTESAEKTQKELNDNFKRYATNTMQRLDQLSRDQVALSKIVSQLSQQLQQNADQLKQIERFVQADLKEFVDPYAGQIQIPKESQYAIHALIPGRAWLRDSQQKIISVVEGQELEGYGKVLTIDPRLGTVIFSSGQLLRY